MLTAEKLQERLTGIGGSDAGTIAGLNPYKTKYELYLEKRGDIQPDDLSDNQRVHFGNVLEDIVAQEYSRRTGKRVRRNNRTLRHKELPFMLANLDREVVGESRLLECKTADKWAAQSDAWGPSGSDLVPESYLLQTQHYLAVTGRQVADLAVLIGGNEFRVYTIGRDESLILDLIELEREFWQCVEDGTPPAADNAREAAARWPSSIPGKALHADDFIKSEFDRLGEIKAQIKTLEKEEAELKDFILPLIQDFEAVIHNQQIIATYKSGTRRGFDKEGFAEAHPELFSLFTTTTATRTLRLKKEK